MKTNVDELLEDGICPEDCGLDCPMDCTQCDIGNLSVLERIPEY